MILAIARTTMVPIIIIMIIQENGRQEENTEIPRKKLWLHPDSE